MKRTDKYFEKFPFLDRLLKGFGQIMLQENSWTGLLFISGLFIGSWQCGAAGILAAISGTVIAILLKFNEDEINSGLYGFSPALTGVALATFFDVTILVWILIIIGGALAAIIQHFFIVRKIPVYTFPFIIVAWTFIFFLRQFTEIPPPDLAPTQSGNEFHYDFFLVTNGFGEIIFQSSRLSGILFFIGVLISSPIAALYGFAASYLGSALSLADGQPIDQIQMGLFGFNAILTAIVFSGTKKTDALWVLIGTVITIVIHNILVDYNVLNAVGGVLTFPFVAGTWITLLIRKFFLQKT